MHKGGESLVVNLYRECIKGGGNNYDDVTPNQKNPISLSHLESGEEESQMNHDYPPPKDDAFFS